jgi:hypothetical protein
LLRKLGATFTAAPTTGNTLRYGSSPAGLPCADTNAALSETQSTPTVAKELRGETQGDKPVEERLKTRCRAWVMVDMGSA